MCRQRGRVSLPMRGCWCLSLSCCRLRPVKTLGPVEPCPVQLNPSLLQALQRTPHHQGTALPPAYSPPFGLPPLHPLGQAGARNGGFPLWVGSPQCVCVCVSSHCVLEFVYEATCCSGLNRISYYFFCICWNFFLALFLFLCVIFFHSM